MFFPKTNVGAPKKNRRRNCVRAKGRSSTYPERRYRANALQGASLPPYCPAFEAQRLGSGSLCGGATSNWLYPQIKFLGKKSRSPLTAGVGLCCATAPQATARKHTTASEHLMKAPSGLFVFA